MPRCQGRAGKKHSCCARHWRTGGSRDKSCSRAGRRVTLAGPTWARSTTAAGLRALRLDSRGVVEHGTRKEDGSIGTQSDKPGAWSGVISSEQKYGGPLGRRPECRHRTRPAIVKAVVANHGKEENASKVGRRRIDLGRLKFDKAGKFTCSSTGIASPSRKSSASRWIGKPESQQNESVSLL